MEVGSAVRAKAAKVRRRAARALTARGRTPVAILDAALVQAGLTTAPFDFGEPGREAGTRATLTPENVILTSLALDEPGRLFAIAHELGHHHLHDDEHLAEGFGLRPIVRDGWVFADGYSYRSVKEVQADLFAWEFLCPSGLLGRRLGAGATPQRLAAALGLPPDLVRGQAVNALLRTDVGPRVRRPPRPRTLDPEQKACVVRHDRPTLVLGGPGSGKTTLLLERARHVLRESGRPSGVLFIASSRTAAERHHASLSQRWPSLAGHAFFGTFEDLAHEIVVRWPHSVGRTDDFRMLDRVAALEAYRSGAGLGRRDAGACGLRVVDGARLGGHVGQNGAADLAKDHDLALAKADKVDGGGLVALANHVLDSHPDASHSLGLRFNHVMVDDLQDAPPAAVTLLTRFAMRASILATADPAQAIDGFRGRSGAAVDAFSSAFAPTVRTLARNHRSSAPIAAVVTALRSRPAGPVIPWDVALSAEAFPNPSTEAEAVAARVVELERRNVPFGKQAVITWANADLDAVADALRRRHVPIVHLGDLSLRREVSHVLAFVRFALHPTDDHLSAAAALPRYAVSPAELDAVVRQAKRGGLGVAKLVGERAAGAGAAGSAWPRLSRLFAEASSIGGGPLTAGVVDWLFASDGLLAPLLRDSRSLEARMTLTAIHLLLGILRDHEVMEAKVTGAEGVARLDRRVRSARSLEQRTRFREVSTAMPDVDAVELLTVRASRGREFETVHAFGLHRKPRKAGSIEKVEDERANLAVALSRARTSLHVSWSLTVDRCDVRPLAPLCDLVAAPSGKRLPITDEAASKRASTA